MAVLMWVSHPERPLQVDELCHTLAVDVGSKDFDSDNVPSIGTLLSCGQGLVAVDKEASTVRLIHHTLQEYLRTRPALFGSAHSKIAETCLTYLNFPNELSGCAKSLALEFLKLDGNCLPSKLLQQHEFSLNNPYEATSRYQLNGLHCASFFGLVEVAAALIEMEGCGINQIGCMSKAPLIRASHRGHEGMVKLLLGQKDIDPDKRGLWDQTALFDAAGYGHEGVVKLLLAREDVRPDRPTTFGRKSLSVAAENGHMGVVKLLLGREDVNPNSTDMLGETPIDYVATCGHRGGG